MSVNPKTAALLGFARKSLKLILGELSVEQGIKNGQAKLVILAGDVADKKKTIIEKWCRDKGISFLELGDKDAYGKLFDTRPQGFIGVTDPQMAQAILSGNRAGGD